MYYTYILLSTKDSKLYIGRSNNLRKRLGDHQTGKVKSTKHRRPLRLISYEAFINKLDSIRRENYLKTSKGKSSLKQLLRESLK